MTEVVHCKSKAEKAWPRPPSPRANKHLDAILGLSPAPLVVVLGQGERDLARRLWSLPPDFGYQKTAAWSSATTWPWSRSEAALE